MPEPKQHKTPLQRYLEACTGKTVRGFILVREGPGRIEERCFLITGCFKTEADLPKVLQDCFAHVGVMVSYEHKTSVASEYTMKVWLSQEIYNAWKQFESDPALKPAFKCVLEFLRSTAELAEVQGLLQAMIRAIVTDEGTMFERFLADAAKYLGSSKVLSARSRVIDYVAPWIPNDKIPEDQALPAPQAVLVIQFPPHRAPSPIQISVPPDRTQRVLSPLDQARLEEARRGTLPTSSGNEPGEETSLETTVFTDETPGRPIHTGTMVGRPVPPGPE